MARQRKGDVVTVLMIIGGILILLSVLVIGVYVYHAYRWGPCWTSFSQRMGEIEKAFGKLKTQESSEVTITMGDCVGSLVFVNKDTFNKINKKYRDSFKCPEGEGFFIGFPKDNEIKSGWRFWLWPEDLWENLVRWWRGTARDIQPLCKSADREIEISDPVIGGPDEGKAKTLCLKIIKTTTDKYGISYEEGACA
jgi:hypothetical protein